MLRPGQGQWQGLSHGGNDLRRLGTLAVYLRYAGAQIGDVCIHRLREGQVWCVYGGKITKSLVNRACGVVGSALP